MSNPVMRAKMRVTSVSTGQGSESLTLGAVYKSEGYPADGSDENNTFALWTPQASLNMTITNPALFGKFEAGQEVYLDFSLAQ